MVWNWQQPDWPAFTWDRSRLEAAEQQFLIGGGVFVGTAKHLGTEERDHGRTSGIMTVRTELGLRPPHRPQASCPA